MTPRDYVGYFFNPNQSSKQGAAILIRKNISHKLLNIYPLLSVVGLEVNTTIRLSVFSLYLPPQDPISVSDLGDLISSINTPLLLVGDFNAWSPLWGSPSLNGKGKILESLLMNFNLSTLNDGSPTHLSSHNTFTHIDLSIASISIVPICNWRVIDDLHNSDHFPIISQVLINNFAEFRMPFKFNTKRANWSLYQNRISQSSQVFDISNDLNKEAATIRRIIRSSANESIPKIGNRKISKSVPWWSAELQKLRDEKQRSWRQFRQNMIAENLVLYRKNNAIFNKAKKFAKTKSFNEFTEKLNPLTPSSTLWQNIRKLTGNFSPTTISAISINGNIKADSNLIAEAFAKHWSDDSLDSNFPQSFQIAKSETLASLEVTSCPTRSMEIEKHFNLQELSYSLSTCRGKSPGLDKISYPMLANAPETFKLRILKLFNEILDSGTIPQFFKTASVVAIHKHNKPMENIDSYRPISLLPCTSKLLEKMISRRLMWFIRKHNLLSKNQVGFQSRLSTMDALLYLDHTICRNRSSRKHTSILSIDFIKAFDKIGIHVVLQKLKDWAIGPKIFKLIKSFLTNRKFTVLVNNTPSKVYPLHNGIPQGSPLSVSLFIIAFDDLSRIISNNKRIEHCIYADDLYLIAKDQSNMDIIQNFSETLLNIDTWSKQSGANISFEKTNHLHICNKHNCDNINIDFNHTNIQNVDKCKILGLIIDRKYNFKDHCNYLKKDLTNRLNIIKYLSSPKSYMHTNSLIRMVKTIILGKIQYGLVIYSKAVKSVFGNVESLFNAAIRTSLRAFRTTPIKNLLAEAGFDSLRIFANRLKFRLVDKIFCNNSSLLYNHINLLSKRKTELKCPSALSDIFKLTKKLNAKNLKTPSDNFPPWLLDPRTFIKDLQVFNKNSTSQDVYKSLFNEIFSTYKNENWEFLFTDGSKTDISVGFAVTSEDGCVKAMGILPLNGSVFESEAEAILSALKISKSSENKFIICTDSRSVFDAASNPRNRSGTIISIQQLLIQLRYKVKLLWIPSHIGIMGNESADKAAKMAHLHPTFNFIPQTIDYISRCLTKKLNLSLSNKWSRYNHPYYSINPNKIATVLPTSTNVHKNKCFTRLRLTHTRITHQYLMTRSSQPVCPFCNTSTLTVIHILSDCTNLQNTRQRIFNSNSLINVLKSPSEININLLQETNLQNEI